MPYPKPSIEKIRNSGRIREVGLAQPEIQLADQLARASDLVLEVTHPSLPAWSIRDLIALARARPDQLLYASAGAGGLGHIAIVQLMSMAGIRLTHVPYKGGGPATTALVSSETQLLVGSPAAVITQLNIAPCTGITSRSSAKSPS
jgi:tripartite-type tricarboxylate transporter receptor subunit TctC